MRESAIAVWICVAGTCLIQSTGCGAPKDTAASSSAASSGAPAKDAAKKDTAGGDTAKKPADKKEPTATKIEQIGLTATLPPNAQIMKMGDSAMVSADGMALTLKVAKDTDPKTVEQGKDGALLGDKGRNLKADKIADGWIVTWENTGSMGDNYWLSMRREIAGKGYMCETMLSNDAQRKAAIDVCNSLKP